MRACPDTVSAVPFVHKHVHQRAGEDEQEGKSSEEMCPVLGKEEEAEHHSEC